LRSNHASVRITPASGPTLFLAGLGRPDGYAGRVT